MNNIESNELKKSIFLYGLKKELNFLLQLYDSQRLPKVLMLSGKKGIGKATMIIHFLNCIYDKKNYDFTKNLINKDSSFNKLLLNDLFPDVIYLSAENFKNVKVDDLRTLKSMILKSSLSTFNRFVIFDTIELFNKNSLNALLKIIEEPSINNYFILINNQTKPVMETIYSRAIDVKITLSNQVRLSTIEALIKDNNSKAHIDLNIMDLTPGNFLIFNKICEENKIEINHNFIQNLSLIINLYKKNKNTKYLSFLTFLVDYYFYNLTKKENKNIDKIAEDKSFVMNNLNNFILYNLNQNLLISSINQKLYNE